AAIPVGRRQVAVVGDALRAAVAVAYRGQAVVGGLGGQRGVDGDVREAAVAARVARGRLALIAAGGARRGDVALDAGAGSVAAGAAVLAAATVDRIRRAGRGAGGAADREALVGCRRDVVVVGDALRAAAAVADRPLAVAGGGHRDQRIDRRVGEAA